MVDQFQTFQSFSDIELANEVSEKLKEKNIQLVIERSKPLLDTGIIGNSTEPDIHIKLRPVDFVKAHETLEDYYKTQLNDIDDDHYLFAFTNDELREIISKPDEWGHFDYQLAQKLLKERGQEMDLVTINKLKKDRINELAEPERASRLLIFFGYCFIPFGIVVAFFIGRHLFYSSRRLPNGQTVFSYSASDRKHGDRIMIVAGILFIVVIAFWLISFLK